MAHKTLKSEKAKNPRKPTIPYSRYGKTKQDVINRSLTKYKGKEVN